MKQKLLLILFTIIGTCLIIFVIQFYRVTQVEKTNTEIVDNSIQELIQSSDIELEETQQHIIQTETKVVYIREKTLQKVQALPPDELASAALDRIERFRTAIRTDHNEIASRDITNIRGIAIK